MRRITGSYFNYYYKTKIRLLYKIVSDFRFKDKGDLMSIAKIELLYSMIYYDAKLGSFNSYLYSRVRGQILNFIRKEKKHKVATLEINNFEGKINPKIDTIFLEEILSSLKDDEREILELYYLSSHTLREIATKLNISTSCAHMTKIRALKKLRENFVCY